MHLVATRVRELSFFTGFGESSVVYYALSCGFPVIAAAGNFEDESGTQGTRIRNLPMRQSKVNTEMDAVLRICHTYLKAIQNYGYTTRRRCECTVVLRAFSTTSHHVLWNSVTPTRSNWLSLSDGSVVHRRELLQAYERYSPKRRIFQ